MSAIQSRKVAGPLVKLLVFAAVTLVLTGVLASTLGSLSLGGGTVYRARFADVTGVLPGDDVRIAGVKVGQVTRVGLVDNRVAQLTLKLSQPVPLPTTVHATVKYLNLIGQRYVELAEGPGGRALLPPDGLIPLSQTTPALNLTVLFNGFQPLFTALSPQDVNSLSYEIIQVLQGESGTVSGLLQHSASLISTLSDQDTVITKVIGNLNSVLATLDSRQGELSDTISQLQQFVSGLAADRTAIGQAITNIDGLTTATGSLIKDARPSLSADVSGLGSLASILNDNTDVINTTLSTLPGEYQSLTRTASYGSWFNFYMCDFDGRVALPGLGAVNPVTFNSTAAACRTGGSK
ncbi:MCE family protein [Rugosimonospora acidiphila]|uniref:MCE family protein n=1 Tax=Rugosimonospora acidiphila TaxID=556531 RepID=A0ABP9SPC0_9ACTN